LQHFKDIKSGEDTNISILQYIASSGVSIDTEIKNIQSGKQTDIVINQFFQRSPDYLRLLEKIKEQDSKVSSLKASAAENWKFEADKLQQLKDAEQHFKSDALRLANLFLKIKPRTERLQQARALFEEGKFKEADQVLKEEDLMNDQDELFAMMDYYEQRQQGIFDNWMAILKN